MGFIDFNLVNYLFSFQDHKTSSFTNKILFLRFIIYTSFRFRIAHETIICILLVMAINAFFCETSNFYSLEIESLRQTFLRWILVCHWSHWRFLTDLYLVIFSPTSRNYWLGWLWRVRLKSFYYPWMIYSL